MLLKKNPLFPRSATICDLGRGIGTDSCYFLSKEHQVILIDIADLALKAAKEKAASEGITDKLTTLHVDLSESTIPLEDHSVDIVFSRLAIHYFRFDRTIEIFKEIKRILKREGKAYITIKSQMIKMRWYF